MISMRRMILSLFLITVLSFSSGAQIRKAENEMTLYHYAEAAALLQKVLHKNDPATHQRAMILLAECYRKLNDWNLARRWYQQVIEAGNASPEHYYYLGHAYRNTGDYAGAKRYFRVYDSLQRGDPRGKLYAISCDSALVWQQQEPGYEIGNSSSLNSPQSEFGPVCYGKGILFTSDRPAGKRPGKKYGWTGNEYLRLFWAEPVTSGDLYGSYREPESFTALSGREWHNGPASFDRHFREVFINRTMQFGDRGKKDPGRIRTHLLKLYTSVRTNDHWARPEAFFLNNQEYSVGHPALSPDGHLLVFVSDQPDGFGGTDIYLCWRQGNGWSDPENAGPVINTPGNEMFPFVPEEGTLYFASDGLPGFGGLDLFVARRENGGWSLPRNLGIPVNSPFDDFSILTDSSGSEGLFSSNRPGGLGGDDMYWFKRIPPSLKLAVGSRDPFIDSLQLADGSWQLSKDSMFYPREDHEFPVPGLEVDKVYILENIYYDFDQWDIREDARPALDSLVSLLKMYPFTIELGSHTDCRGSEEYNEELSRKRAESAVQYIISQGIDPVRIVARGYGKTKLINRCDCREGIECSEKEHQENRRTEFRILF